MKKTFDAIGWRFLILLAILPFFLGSCQQYDNSIHARGLADSGFYAPIDSSYLAYLEATGFEHIDSSHAGVPLHFDSVYTVSPTWAQAWKWAGERNGRVWFWIGLALLIVPLVVYIYVTSKGNSSMTLLLLPAFAIFVGGGIMGSSIEWERWNMDQQIPKSEYQSLMKVNGDLGGFWDTIRVK